jgi:UDP-N-acetylglucosamine acyltransferase
LYREDLTLQAAQIKMANMVDRYPEATKDIQMMLDFLAGATAQRGIVR